MELRRELGLVEVAALAASMMLGVGIFFGPSLTAREFPHTPTVLLIWAAGGAIAMCGAWLMGRLGGMLPLSGGPYAYVRAAFGEVPAYLFAWTSFVIIAPTSLAVLATIFAANLAQLSPLSERGLALMALWSLVAFGFANALGVKTGGRVQAFATALKVILVAGVIAIVFALSREAPSAQPPIAGGGRLSLAFVGVLFAFGGWEYAVLASEEVRDPKRTIPRGLLLGAGIVTILYLAVTAAYLVALGPAGVASATALAPEAAGSAGAGFRLFVAVAVALSAAGTINAIMLLGPRATYAVARDGLAPSLLARVSRWGTPVVAIVVQGALAACYLLLGAFETVATYTVIGTGLFIAWSAVAFVVLSRRAGHRLRALEWAALLVVGGAYAWFIVWSLVDAPRTAGFALALIAAGALPYAFFKVARRWRSRAP